MLPACCALWVPVRLADSGNLIVGVLGSTPCRTREAERRNASRSLRRTRLRGRVTPAHPTREQRPVPRKLVAHPLPGYRTCALIGRVCVYNRQTQIAYAIPARREQRGVGDATGSRPQADDGGTPSLNQAGTRDPRDRRRPQSCALTVFGPVPDDLSTFELQEVVTFGALVGRQQRLDFLSALTGEGSSVGNPVSRLPRL